MSFLIALDSTNRQVPQEPTHNFTTFFDPPLALYKKPGHAWHVALHKLNCWYSFYNISAADYNNHQIGVDFGGGMQYLTIPDGIYNIYQLSDAINSLILTAGGVAGNVTLVPNFPRLRIILQISGGYEVDLDPNNIPGGSTLYQLLGFSLAQVTGGNITVSTEGANVADITNGIDNLYVNCSLVRGSWFRSKSSRVLFSFIPDSPPGSSIQVIPQVPIYLPVEDGTDYIREINMKITDNEDRIVDFNGEDFQYLLHFELRKI